VISIVLIRILMFVIAYMRFKNQYAGPLVPTSLCSVGLLHFVTLKIWKC
jgi:hypothetical protein